MAFLIRSCLPFFSPKPTRQSQLVDDLDPTKPELQPHPPDSPSSPKNPEHAQLAAARARLQTAGEELHDTRTALTTSQSALSHLQSQYRALQATLAQTRDLLETRTAELEAAQVFLGTSEAFTDVQIAEGVKGLNYEAMQIAVALAGAEEWFGGVGTGNGGMGEGGGVEEARRWIGAPLVDALRSADNAQDPLLLEIALQACIVAVVHQVLVRWHFGADEEEDASHAYLDKISSKIFASEPAAVSGRWRVLTRKYAQAALQTHHDADTTSIALIIASALSSVILLAHISPPPFTAHSAPHAPSTPYARTKSLILNTVGDRLHALVAECVTLNRAIGEGITSASIVPFVVSPGAKYDERCMVDDHEAGGEVRDKDGEVVLCSTGLGLRRDVKRADGSVESALLVKSGVALRAVVGLVPKRAEGGVRTS